MIQVRSLPKRWSRSQPAATTRFVVVLGGILSLASSGCRQPQAERPRSGALMAEVGRRFELLGRAAAARRWDLASFELEELGEVFEDLPRAKLPQHANVDLRGLEQAFTKANVAELDAALRARDLTGLATAFARAAGACNGCHQATGHAFVEIPAEPGAGVPKLDPIP